ncbi:Transposase IS116/IS110/IS902 family protein [Bacteroides faecichinchillae]|uniref:Transposase IS116/IS110/IS902 family protein n=2 Tax=Bacteroidia TaxID=200643 RepID=A0A1M5GEW1_9BACE|nr:IS110 family transposase [Bacteroides faecichinchillae]SHG02330.1 Transposase IS116/IS110/IS902 family protein [Bacteroides faecichinchillae]
MSKSTKKKKSEGKNLNEFSIINPNAAGIDISSKDYVVSVPMDRDKKNIRTFGAFTCDLKEIARWLLACKIDTVAMESTGVYWKQLFMVLQEHGLEVFLVNSRHVKNVNGKKTDEQDAHWIMRLHTCGLLTNSFQPEERIRTLRELLRHRKSLNKSKTIAVNKMTKTLNTMNIKLNIVLSDLTSKSGQNIIAAINAGERRPKELVKLVHYKVKASREDILKALEGVWREECLFELKQATEYYYFLQNQTLECDKKIEEQLEIITAKYAEGDITRLKQETVKKYRRKNELNFNVNPYLKRILEINVLKIYGFSDETALTLFAEVGSDLSGFATANKFASWTGLAPNNKISGGKIISSRLPNKKHDVKKALIQAANSLYRSNNAMGDCYRRLKSRMGPKAAKCAMARKMAIIYYHMITKKEEFNIELFEKNQAAFKEKRIKFLENQLAQLNNVA